MNVLAQAAGVVSTGEAITFWILGPIALAGALGMVFARNAVHSALGLVVTMFCLAILYIAGQAPFLGFVQIIVYTGAVMMLFLFVLMLVGRDSSDSVVEVLRGQRLAGLALGVGLAVLLVGAIGGSLTAVVPVGLDADGANGNGNVTGIGRLVFTTYLFAFELTSALLITAALGAMVLTLGMSRGQLKPGQRATVDRAAARRARPDLPAARPRRLRHRQLGGAARGAARRVDRTGVDLGHHRRGRRAARRRARGRPARPDRRRRTRLRARGRLRGRGQPMTPTYYLMLSALLFTIGAVGVLVRRNAIVVFMCIELMLNAVNLTLVTFSRINGTLDGQVMAFFVMVVAAAEVVVGLAIITSIFRTRRTASVDDANLLKY